MNTLTRLRARAHRAAAGASATLTLVALPFVLAMLTLGKDGPAENPRLTALRSQRDKVNERLQLLLARAGVSGEENLSASDSRKFQADNAARTALDEEIKEIEDHERRELSAAAAAGRGGAHVRRESGIYNPEARDHGYLSDLVRRQLWNDSGAAERLAQYRHEVDVEQRDISRVDGAAGEFVPPAWVLSAYAEFARAGRVTADLCQKFDLPPGTDSINVPRITTGAQVAAQTADNAAVQETDMVTNSVEAKVRTLAGQQDLALQLLEQSPIAFDQVVFKELLADHARVLDAQVLDGTNASGQLPGVFALTGRSTTTYTDASPSLAELYPKLAGAVNAVITNRQLPPEAWVMHARRWMWMLATLDSSNRPLVVPMASGPTNATATAGDLNSAGRSVGTLLGLPVFLDNNITTAAGAGTEDKILTARFSDAFLYESQPKMRILPEVLSGTLTVRCQLYSYVGFAPGRFPASFSEVVGSGLIAPTF